MLRGLLKRILNERKQDFKVKGMLEKKISDMWSKKHAEKKHKEKAVIKYKEERKDGTSFDVERKWTTADNQALRIIQQWVIKKKQIQGNKPETKKAINEELERFKEV